MSGINWIPEDHKASGHHISRRAERVLGKLNAGWVAEEQRAFGRQKKGAWYLLRSPGAHEPLNAHVHRLTMLQLLESGLAIELYIPSRGLSIVLSSAYYNAHEAAFSVLTAPEPPRTTNHPPPRFRSDVKSLSR